MLPSAWNVHQSISHQTRLNQSTDPHLSRINTDNANFGTTTSGPKSEIQRLHQPGTPFTIGYSGVHFGVAANDAAPREAPREAPRGVPRGVERREAWPVEGFERREAWPVDSFQKRTFPIESEIISTSVGIPAL